MVSVSVDQLMAESDVKFGTSGARGLVSEFTDKVAAAYAVAFVKALSRQGFQVSCVALGIDRRPSSPSIAAAIAGVLHALGYKVEFYGVLPTPALALHAMSEAIPAIMVTGSHIPFDRNGIKFYRPDGEITKQDETAILAQTACLPEFTSELPSRSLAALKRYEARYVAPFANTLKGWKVGVYEHSAAGRDVTKSILQALGAQVVSLGKTDTFTAIDTEAVSIHDQAQAKTWSAEYQLDAIFSTDGDGDRPLIADECGQWLKGDAVGMLCAHYIGAHALAVPVSCNSAIEAFTQVPVIRTRIGSPYVIEAMARQAAEFDVVAGFEANGGFMCGTDFTLNGINLSALPTRDALLPLIVLLNAARERGFSLSQLISQLPARFTASDRVIDFSTALSQSLIAGWQEDITAFTQQFALSGTVQTVNTIDGLRLMFSDGDIVHLRPSGNAPELRCYCEAASQELADDLLSHMLAGLSELRCKVAVVLDR